MITANKTLGKKITITIIAIFILVSVMSMICSSGMVAVATNEVQLNNYITNFEKEQFSGYNPEYQLSLLYNIDDEPEYILAYNKNGVGYEVYNRISGELMESCPTADNPYLYVTKGYYLSAFNYAYGNLSNLINIESKVHYSKNEKKKIKEQHKIFRERTKNVRANKKLKDESSSSLDFNNVGFSFNVTQADTFSNVQYPGVIKRMTTSFDFGNNTDGSCAAVACNILFQYADVIYGGVVPYLPPENWVDCTNGHIVTSNTGGTYDCTINDANLSIFTKENMHKYLIKLSGATSLGLTEEEREDLMSQYCREINLKGCLGMISGSGDQGSASDFYGNAKYVIENVKTPVVASIYYTKNGNNSSLHAVVVYGVYYNTSSNQYYFRVHAGHNGKSDCVINGDFINSNGVYTTLLVLKNNKHSLMPVDATSHTCSNTKCYGCNNAHRYFYKSSAKHVCACGYEQDHDYVSASSALMNGNVIFDSNITQFCRGCGCYA